MVVLVFRPISIHGSVLICQRVARRWVFLDSGMTAAST